MGIYVHPSQISDPTKQTPGTGPEIPAPSRWHKTADLPDNTSLGRLGAYWYILDQNGCAISDGYHEISLDEHGDYKGKRSTRSERIMLYTESN